MKLTNIHKILFITLSNIGDVVLTLPVLSALKDNFPNAKIDVVVGLRPKEIFAKDPGISRIFAYDKHASLKEKLGFIKKLRSESYDLAVDMRTSLIPVLIGAKKRTALISINKSVQKHKRAIHLNKLKTVGIPPFTPTLPPSPRLRRTGSPVGRGSKIRDIYIDNKDREAIGRLVEEKGLKRDDILIGISPACRSPLKQWRTEGFIEVINNLLRHSAYKIVLIGDITQTKISTEITNAIRHEGLIDLTGKINLNELFALMERMQVLLTCDSACLHIGCDLGVKVVAIFGPTDPEEYGPTGKDDIVIRRSIKCSPCRKAICSFDHECMKQINAEEVLAAVKKLLISSDSAE